MQRALLLYVGRIGLRATGCCLSVKDLGNIHLAFGQLLRNSNHSLHILVELLYIELFCLIFAFLWREGAIVAT